MLGDGRIACGGENGSCAIISAPKKVKAAIQNYVTYTYASTAITLTRVPPLRAAWMSVQNRELSLLDACTSVITAENCSRSLDEWCIAHNLLMEAVKRHAVPASRDYDGINSHWYLELYQHCDKLAIGEKVIQFLVSLFKQAEDANVAGDSARDVFISAVKLRNDIDKDNRFVVHAIFHLFMRQAESDVRLQQVLHYQRVQQVTAVVNAVLGCIPIGGAIATNAFSGGAAILNDLQICGLVESFMGVAKDASGGFGTDNLVDRFLCRGNEALSPEKWADLPPENRKVVEEAAESLGLTIDELREKLLIVATMQTNNDTVVPSEQVIIAQVEGGSQSAIVDCDISPEQHAVQAIQGTNNPSILGRSGDGYESAPTIAGPNHDTRRLLEVNCDGELRTWKELGIGRDSIGELGSEQVASLLAAFLVNYDASHSAGYLRLRRELTARLGISFSLDCRSRQWSKRRKTL